MPSASRASTNSVLEANGHQLSPGEGTFAAIEYQACCLTSSTGEMVSYDAVLLLQRLTATRRLVTLNVMGLRGIRNADT